MEPINPSIQKSSSRTLQNGDATTPVNLAASPPKALRAGPRLPDEGQNALSPPPHYVVNYTVNYDDLEFYEHLGAGRYGSVHRALLKSRNIIVAVKKVESLGQEVHILSQLSHRNIVRFYGIYTHVLLNSASRVLQFGIITEYCDNGSLYDLLKRIRPNLQDGESETGLNFLNILQWAADIARGMNYLHSEAPVQIIHRDLKSTNVVLSRDWMCKICDFGSSRARNRDNSIISVAGTPAWMAPELIRGEANFNSGCDTWSFGVVLWELLTCEQPFKGLDQFQIMFVVGSRSEHPPIPGTCPAIFQDLLTRCWSKEPSARPVFSEIVVELAKMLTDDDLPSELANFTSSSARRAWLMEVETELARVKLIEQSLEEREHVIAERERQLAEQKKMIDMQMSRLVPSSSQGHLATAAYSPVDRLDVLNWTEADVARWVRQLDQLDHFRGLGKYANLFEANHIGGRRLLLLSKSDFHAMGITSLGHQKQFLDEINFLRIASQMVVDFPPLQITSQHNSATNTSALTPSQSGNDAVFQVGESDNESSLSSPSTPIPAEMSISIGFPTANSTLNSGAHTPLSVNVSNSNSFVVVENREFFVNLAVGMYTFPTTISESGHVNNSIEYRVFVDAHVSFDPTNMTSPDDAIAITDVDLTLDVANIFSTVLVIFDPDLPTERKVYAATGASESNPNLQESSAPYIAKETASPSSQQPFSVIEIEVALRQPYCCRFRQPPAATVNGTGDPLVSPPRPLSRSASKSSSRTTSPTKPIPFRIPEEDVELKREHSQSFDYVGVIRKRLPANFNSPIVTWSECVTQLATRTLHDDSANGGGVHFSINSPDADQMSLSSNCTARSAPKTTGKSPLPHSPRHPSILGITSPVNNADPAQFYSDARRNSVSLTSPIENRPSTPVAAIIGQQVKVEQQNRKPYSSHFFSSGFSPASSSSLTNVPVKTYASVAAAAKPQSSSGLTVTYQTTYHGHHPSHHGHHLHNNHRHHENTVSPALRHAIKNTQRQHNRTNSASSGGSATNERHGNRQYFKPGANQAGKPGPKF